MSPHRLMTGFAKQMSLTQQRGAATLQTENEDDVRVHGETKQSVFTPVSRSVLCLITVSVHMQSYCGERKKTLTPSVSRSTCKAPSFPSTSAAPPTCTPSPCSICVYPFCGNSFPFRLLSSFHFHSFRATGWGL